MFKILSDTGLDILNYAVNIAESVVNIFLTELRELAPILGNFDLGFYTLFEIMFGVGLPLYLTYTSIVYIAKIIT